MEFGGASKTSKEERNSYNQSDEYMQRDMQRWNYFHYDLWVAKQKLVYARRKKLLLEMWSIFLSNLLGRRKASFKSVHLWELEYMINIECKKV